MQATNNQNSRFRKLMKSDISTVIALAILVIVFSIASPYFLNFRNLMNIGIYASIMGTMAAGLTVAMLLGGYFGSRLMQNLREANGFTYGVVAAMVNLEREGYLAVATQVARDATDRALAEIYREIERLRTEPVAEEELSLVRNMMTGEMMRILDGPFGIADVTIENILCGRRNDVVSENLQRIRAITPAEVQRLAVKYLPREALVTVVAGGPESVL